MCKFKFLHTNLTHTDTHTTSNKEQRHWSSSGLTIDVTEYSCNLRCWEEESKLGEVVKRTFSSR